MRRPPLSLVPRVVFLLFAVVCTLFALAALWSTLAGATFHISGHVYHLLRDTELFGVIQNTAILFTLSVGVQLLICVIGTMFITSVRPGVMAMLLIPYATGVIAPSFAFFVLLSTGVGPLNISLASSVSAQRIVITLIDTWQWLGILLVAAFFQINQIPRSYFELADLEGMSLWTRWRRIVWPQVWFVLLFYSAFRLLDWLRKVDIVKAIFDRGYAGRLQTFAMYAEQVRFRFGSNDAGTASSIQDPYGDFLLLLQILILVVAAIYISRTRLVNGLYSAAR